MIFPFFNFSGFSEDDIRYMDGPISESSIGDTAVECDNRRHYELPRVEHKPECKYPPPKVPEQEGGDQ